MSTSAQRIASGFSGCQGVSLDTFSQFLQAYLPPQANDVPYMYHVPRHPFFDSGTALVRKAIFSITPTQGVYQALETPPASRSSNHGVIVAFLHRPWALDRYRVPKKSGVVLASHKSLDEVLTTGWNVQLASRLGIDLTNCQCVQGYKGDPERRIGLVGSINVTEAVILDAVWREFGVFEACFGFNDQVQSELDSAVPSGRIKVVAIMNAFHPDEVERVAETAAKAGFIADAADCRAVLYLTGAARPPGVEAAVAKGMKVICVGHKPCEDWGIRFLAAQTRAQFPELEVVEIDEPEEPRRRDEILRSHTAAPIA